MLERTGRVEIGSGFSAVCPPLQNTPSQSLSLRSTRVKEVLGGGVLECAAARVESWGLGQHGSGVTKRRENHERESAILAFKKEEYG